MGAAELKMVIWTLRVTLKERLRRSISGGRQGSEESGRSLEESEEEEMIWACEQMRRKLVRLKSDEI